MAKVSTMDDLLVDELRDLYDAEKQLTKALPKMAKAASSDELRMAIEAHLKQTQNQVERLDQIFESLDQKATGKKCEAMAGLIKEGEDVIGEVGASALRDAGIIAAAQKVEHYEIAGYGSARSHAQILGHVDAVSLLEQTLSEEKEADQKLNDIAEESVNEEAVNASGGQAQGARSRSTSGSKASNPRTRTAGH